MLMRKQLLLLAGMFMALAMHAANETDTLVVRIKGMRCEDCAHKVNTVLRAMQGVESVKYNLERRTAAIAYNPLQVSTDTIKSRLSATGRYKPSPYSRDEVIRRGMGLQMSDMYCQDCADRIVGRLQQIAGVDSMAPKLDKHYVFIRYDANRTSKAVIRQALLDLGFTPVNYYTSRDISFAYFLVPEAEADDETVETVLAMDGVDDAAVNARRRSLAVTYVNTETSAERLLEQLHSAGIAAVVPPAHECKEQKE